MVELGRFACTSSPGDDDDSFNFFLQGLALHVLLKLKPDGTAAIAMRRSVNNGSIDRRLQSDGIIVLVDNER